MTTRLPHGPEALENRCFVQFARAKMGTAVLIEDRSRDFGRPSLTWRLSGGDGSRAWLKHHRSSHLYQRELIGLTEFVPALGDATADTARLLARDDEFEIVLMSEVAGVEVETLGLGDEDLRSVHRLAGEFARGLHGLDLPCPHELGAAEDLRQRSSRYVLVSEPHVEEKTVSWARELIEEVCSGHALRRVPCHNDYSPRNWLVRGRGGSLALGVIDWERARWDLWQQDVQRMMYEHWHGRPDLREAYLEGYGRLPTEVEDRQLELICLAGAMASIPWALEHGDHDFAARSREAILRIRRASPTAR